MQIKGTNWYTACRKPSWKPIPGSERVEVGHFIYGYRMPVGDRPSKEVNEYIKMLKDEYGVTAVLKKSKQAHTDIPAGTPYLTVWDEKSIIALEKMFLENGIELRPDRYKEYGMSSFIRNLGASVRSRGRER